jgi:hypothetical protein
LAILKAVDQAVFSGAEDVRLLT